MLPGGKEIMPSFLEKIEKTFHSILKNNQFSIFSSGKTVKFSFQLGLNTF